MPRNDNAVANVDVLLEQKAANVVHYLFCHSFVLVFFFFFFLKANVLFGTSIKVKYEIRLLGHTFLFVIFRRLTPLKIS